MIGASATSVNETIHEALAKATAAVEQVGVSRWSFTLSNGKPLKATGRIEDGWFLLDAALHTGKKRRPIARARVWELLCCNASIPWGGKFALSPGGRSIRLRAEIPMLDDEVDLAARIGNVCAGLKAALRMFRRKKTARHARSFAPRSDVCRAEDKVDLPGLLTESGWPFAERSGGALAVELDVPDAFYQATVEEQKHQGVRARAAQPTSHCLPKLCGGDVELGNFVQKLDRPGGTGYEASRALLPEIAGLPQGGSYQGRCNCASCRARRLSEDADVWGTNTSGSDTVAGFYVPQDWGRKYLPSNGGCAYIDLNHLELCLPEVLSAYDHVAAWHAMLRIARDALDRANEKLPEGRKIQVLVNNSDGQGNSYGSHMNFLISRRCFDNIFERKLHHMLFLASYLASSTVFAGAGKVGSEAGNAPVDFQLSQRADFYKTLTGPQTTHHRPIVNSRDEPLCGHYWGGSPSGRTRHMARLHVIFFDSTLCHVSSLLKIGVTQIILAMLEQEYVAPGLILDDPLRAVIRWSHDRTLRAKCRLLSGAEHTAVELQLALLEKARRFVDSGRTDGIVPHARDIMALWQDTVLKLKAGDFAALAPRLDWVLKLSILERAMSQRGLDWESPELKHLDHLYSSLSEGLYWAYERSGVVQKVVSDAEVERFVHEPPDNTRAWLRAHVLRRADPATIRDVDWDAIRFKVRDERRGFWSSYSYYTLAMDDPLRFTKVECESALNEAASLEDALQSLSPEQTDCFGRPLAKTKAAVTDDSFVPQTLYLPAAADEVAEVPDDGTVGPKYAAPEHQKGGADHETAGKKT